MLRFKLNSEVAKCMEENGCDEEAAANILQLNRDEVYDVVEDGGDYTFDTED